MEKMQENLRERLCGRQPHAWDGEAGMVFAAPWHAQVFSMTVALNEAGHFTWSQWVEVFSRHRERSAQAQRSDDGDMYFLDWLAALEEISAMRGLASREMQGSYQRAWDKAVHRTRHGQPIALQPDDFVGDDADHQ